LTNAHLLRSQVCRSHDEVLATSEQWKPAMIVKGARDMKLQNSSLLYQAAEDSCSSRPHI
jgi:hypothetical protein